MKTAPAPAIMTIAPPTVAVPTGETRKSARASVVTSDSAGGGVCGRGTGVGFSVGVGAEVGVGL